MQAIYPACSRYKEIETSGETFSMKSIFSGILLVSCSVLLLCSSCQKELSSEVGLLDSAKGTLKDSTGNCMPVTVHGTYYDGITPGADTCYIDLRVNVTETGSYSISTDMQNGFKFVDSGFFNAIGINIIKLKPIGTPIIPVATIFSVSFDSSTCSFAVTVQDSTGTGLGGGGDTTGTGGGGDTGDSTAAGTWKFTDSTNNTFYTGVFQDPGGIFNLDSWGWQLTLLGSNNLVTADTTFFLSVQMPSSQVAPGTYLTNASPSSGWGLSDQTGAVVYYRADATTPQIIKVNITSYDDATKVVKGNFSGTAVFNSSTVYITHGAFNTTLP